MACVIDRLFKQRQAASTFDNVCMFVAGRVCGRNVITTSDQWRRCCASHTVINSLLYFEHTHTHTRRCLVHTGVIFKECILLTETPYCLFLKLIPANERHDYNTRQALSSHFALPLPRTNAVKKTVMYRAISYWNMLPPHLTIIRNKFGFKKKLKEAIIRNDITFA